MILTIWVPVLIKPAHFVLTKKFWQEKAWKHLIYFYTKLRTIVYHQKYCQLFDAFVGSILPYNDNDNDNEIIFISIETFTHSYIHDKQWKYGKVKKSWTYISDFPNSYINKLRQH